MLCLDLPHLEVKFKIVKEFTIRSQKKDGGGHRVRALENRGQRGTGNRRWEVWIPPPLSLAPTWKGSRSESFHFRWEEVLASHKFYPGSNPRGEAICGLNLLLVLILEVRFSKVPVIIALGDGSINVCAKGVLSTRLGREESLIYGAFPVHWPYGYAMLMSANKGETAVRGCHCPDDMIVRMREVLARPWAGVCVLLALSLSESNY